MVRTYHIPMPYHNPILPYSYSPLTLTSTHAQVGLRIVLGLGWEREGLCRVGFWYVITDPGDIVSQYPLLTTHAVPLNSNFKYFGFELSDPQIYESWECRTLELRTLRFTNPRIIESSAIGPADSRYITGKRWCRPCCRPLADNVMNLL